MKIIFAILIILLLLLIIFHFNQKIYGMLKSFHIHIKKWKVYVCFLIVFFILFYLKSVFVMMLLYMILFFLVFDVLHLFLNLIHINNKYIQWMKKLYCHGIWAVILSFLVVVCGIYNSKNTVVKEYKVTTEKEFGKLNIIMISDTHYGTGCEKKQLKKMVTKINNQNPDVVCMVGDIFDESSSNKDITQACEIFSNLKSKYGVYYVTGNHDDRYCDKFSQKLTDAGVTILRDETILVDDSFYIVGRNDGGYEQTNRKSLENVIKDINEKYPIILLDHRPIETKEAKKENIDLELCGHTHDGQFFPGNLFVHLFNDLAYGHERDGDYNLIVSSGVGVWGFPVRTAGHSEIVKVVLQGEQ